jgi:hypothetical protein
LVAVIAAAGGLTGASTANAVLPILNPGVLPTTTTVTASASTITQGQSVTLTSTVKVLNVLPGLIVTPTGTVTFANGAQLLGVGTISNCFLITCTVKTQTAALPAGLDTVTATYSGAKLLTSASSASTTVSVANVVACPANVDCDTGPQSLQLSSGGNTTTTTYEVIADGSNGPQTVSEAVVAPNSTFVCGGGAPADPTIAGVIWNGTASDVTKTVYVDVFGEGAAYIAANGYFNGETRVAVGCYSSTQPFTGYVSTGSGYVYTDAPQVTNSDGTYYQALLSTCNAAVPLYTTPCATNIHVAQNDGPPYAVYDFSYEIDTSIGDPKHLPD